MGTSEAIDRLLVEDRVSMGEAARLVAPGTHPSTVTRWCLRGVRLAGGGVVRLEFYRAGGRMLTSRQAINRFLSAQSQVIGGDVGPTTRTPTQRERAAALAGAELDRLGI